MERDSLHALLHQITQAGTAAGDQLLETARSSGNTSGPASRRTLLLSPLMAALQVAFWDSRAQASKLNPSQTVITLPSAIKWSAWTGVPSHTAEMATLYGGLNQPGPYLVYMKWYPGYMSAPHRYATDRLSVVLSGTWWVNSGEDFTPENCVPVPAGGFVRRVAHTWHYDGVKAGAGEPTVIAIFGMGPVDLELADPNKPGWRRV